MAEFESVWTSPAILGQVIRHLPRSSQLQCCLVNRTWCKAARPQVYGWVYFGSYWVAPLTAWLCFLALLPNYPLAIRQCVRRLDLRGVEEALYTTVDRTWLARALQYLPALERLDLNRCALLDSQALRHGSGTTSTSVRTLCLTHNDNLSVQAIQLLPTLFPNLTLLDLVGTRGVTDQNLGLIADRCAELAHLRLGRSAQVSDQGILALVKMAKTRLRHLALIALPRVTDQALWHLARHCPRLTHLTLAGCPLLTVAGVSQAIDAAPHRTSGWVYLDVTQCRGMYNTQLMQQSLGAVLASRAPRLTILCASFKSIASSTFSPVLPTRPEGHSSHASKPNAEDNLAEGPWSSLTHLVLDEFPGSPKSIDLVVHILQQLRQLKRLELYSSFRIDLALGTLTQDPLTICTAGPHTHSSLILQQAVGAVTAAVSSPPILLWNGQQVL
ncbi:hypothetical protein H4R35_004882 [Dimargaris xerosporica]|nr:hypothetical protein H4R35_004882 [Dimargaris xerosporica]